MITTLLLIRHGITQSNIENIYMGFSEETLNQEGFSQVDQLSLRLKKIPIAAIYSSPLKRTTATAERISKDRNIEITTLDDLKEIDFGDWEGLPKETIKQKWPLLYDQIKADPGNIVLPEGESFKDAMERSIKAFEEISSTNANKCAVIITHEIIIKMMIIHVLNASTNIYSRFQNDWTSISKITISGRERKLITANDTSHLAR